MGSNKKHYAVIRGFRPGIYNTWFGPGGAEEQVKGYANALYKGFSSREEAELWQKTGAPDLRAETAVVNKPVRKRGQTLESRAVDKEEVPDIAASDHDSVKAPSSQKIIIYTDGGCRRNPGPGGYGAVVMDGNSRRELSQGFRLTTNNRMELMACIAALQSLKGSAAVVLHSDSQYVVNGIQKGWAKKWRAKGWMRTKEEAAVNPDLWSVLLDLCDRHRVQFVWVRGHAGTKENERCDRLATEAALSRKLREDSGYLPQRLPPAAGAGTTNNECRGNPPWLP